MNEVRIMPRWTICEKENAVVWRPLPGDEHTDDIEMAGFGCSQLVFYGTGKDGLILRHHPVFPTLRLRPNNTHASYQKDVPEALVPRLAVNGEPVRETLVEAKLCGYVELNCSAGPLAVRHLCFPSAHKRACYEIVTVSNTGTEPVTLTATAAVRDEIDQTMGPMGVNVMELFSDFRPVTLGPGEKTEYSVAVAGRLANEKPDFGNAREEFCLRLAALERLTAPLALDTGDAALDLMFRFAKIRAGESVFETRYGKIHSPGGMSYYAATWCNDQVEYAGPYFAYTGDDALLEASMNAYRMYMPFMSDRYEPIPSSVIAEGIDYWNGAGDRGDAAMYLYGASRFALTSGRREYAEELLPAIEWCAEYCERKKTADGVIASDRDELEGRFPSGDANLCTSTLAFAGLLSAAALEREIGSADTAAVYEKRAAELAAAIERWFGAEIHGYKTYRYYEGCEILRSWICMPLCVGLFDRAAATADALCSPYLMRRDGLLTAEGSTTIWDRSTLYGLRGIFASGSADRAEELLAVYVENRLLGERVPYPVEAYPEGGRRHLSGESALFCKIILEGICGLAPTGLSSFTIKPTLPRALDHLYLCGVRAHGAVFSVLLEKDGWRVEGEDGTLLACGKNGECAEVGLKKL